MRISLSFYTHFKTSTTIQRHTHTHKLTHGTHKDLFKTLTCHYMKPQIGVRLKLLSKEKTDGQRDGNKIDISADESSH